MAEIASFRAVNPQREGKNVPLPDLTWARLVLVRVLARNPQPHLSAQTIDPVAGNKPQTSDLKPQTSDLRTFAIGSR